MKGKKTLVKWISAAGALWMGAGLLTACLGPASNPAGTNGGGVGNTGIPASPTVALVAPTTVSAVASSIPTAAPAAVSPTPATPPAATPTALAATPDATITSLTDQIDQELKDLENSNEDQTLQPLLQ